MRTFDATVDAEATFIGTEYPTTEEIEGFFQNRGVNAYEIHIPEDPEDGLVVGFDFALWDLDAEDEEDAESLADEEAAAHMADFARKFGLRLTDRWADSSAEESGDSWDAPEGLDGGEDA